MRRAVACHADEDTVFRYLGYAGQKIDGALEHRIARVISECESASRPSWCCQAFPVVERGGEVSLAGSTLRFPTQDAAAVLGRAAACAVMVCTLGLANELAFQRLMAVEATDALVFDAAGSSLVESCADDCERAVLDWACAWGLHAGQRTSPGYGGLALSLQGDIVRALDAGKALGVSVTESDLLIPLKSITAFVGLFEHEDDARQARRSCAECVAARDCAYLQAGRPCWDRKPGR